VLDKGKDLNRHKIPLAIEENLRDPPQYILVKETRQLRDYGAVLPVGHRLELDAATFLSGMKQNTTITLQHELGRQNGLKFEQILTVELEKEKLSVDQIFRIFEGGVHDAASDIITAVAYLKSGQKPLLHAGEIEASLGGAAAHILEELENWTNNGSGWNLKRCIALDLQVTSPCVLEGTF